MAALAKAIFGRLRKMRLCSDTALWRNYDSHSLIRKASFTALWKEQKLVCCLCIEKGTLRRNPLSFVVTLKVKQQADFPIIFANK